MPLRATYDNSNQKNIYIGGEPEMVTDSYCRIFMVYEGKIERVVLFIF